MKRGRLPKANNSYHRVCKRCDKIYKDASKYSEVCAKCRKKPYWSQLKYGR